MKYLYSLIVMAFFAIGFAASDDEESSSTITFKNERCGTYVITDEDNVSYTIKVNDDYTIVAESNGHTYYGSWSIQWKKSNSFIRFEFAGENEDKPRIKFKGGEYWIDNNYAIADDRFLYGDAWGYGTPDRHDPQRRLKYRKIN